MALKSSELVLLGPPTIFGGDVADRATSGDFEGTFASEQVFTGWTAGTSISGLSTTDFQAGASAQIVAFPKSGAAVTAAEGHSFAQQLAGLDTDNDYGLTAYVKVTAPTHPAGPVYVRVGPNSGGDSFQASATAAGGATADYQLIELTWSNTAASPWVFFASDEDGTTAQIDSIVIRSASASTMDANTASPGYLLSTPSWTITVPNGIDTPASGVPYRVEVNNANPHDPNKKDHYVNPQMYALKSFNKQQVQAAASASNFESRWINLGDMTTSAYVGVGTYRYVRIVNAGGFTGASSAFEGHLWTQHKAPMI